MSSRVQSWYGLHGDINVENDLWHLVRVSGIPVPHPPLANLILRAGLPNHHRQQLSFQHEYAHLQTFPFMLLLALPIASRPLRNKRGGWFERLKRLFWVLVFHQAIWELANETYIMASLSEDYRRIYVPHEAVRGGVYSGVARHPLRCSPVHSFSVNSD